jgi:Fanconi anemia group M protein
VHSDALKGTSKAVKNIVIDPDFKSANYITELLSEKKENHPKIEKLKELLFKEILDVGLTGFTQKKIEKKAIIFTQYRDSAKRIHEVLSQIKGLKPKIFVGQAKKSDTGLSQKEQKQIIEDFKEGRFNLLISTSVGEEGLDIPAVDLVVFYEPVPSAIRHIQRRGRTGRQEKGKVFVLLAKNTRDEAYRWSSFHKEKGMKNILGDIKKDRDFLKGNNVTENNDSEIESKSKENNELVNKSEKPKIFADFREKASDVLKELDYNGIVELELSKLNVGDFILSERVALEFKNTRDFVNSIIDGRLLPQIRDLKENYLKPVLIIQGEDIFSQANIHENSIRGIIIAITVGFRVPIIFSKDAKETAKYIQTIALRENMQKLKDTSPHGNRKQMALKEAQKYIVSAIPGVGPTLSEPILKRFKTIKNIANASEKDFLEIEKIGEKKARSIFEIFNEEYE